MSTLPRRLCLVHSGAAHTMPYALLKYRTTNLGDPIQSLAARQFLPSVDLLVDRDALNALPPGEERFRIVLNGWHNHAPETWPPSPRLDPLLISMHISGEVPAQNRSGLRASEVLLSGANLDYLKAHAPVGARDLWTRDLLRAAGVDAYFSGCLTLTIGDDTPRPRRDYICAVDLPPRTLDVLRGRTHSRVLALTQEMGKLPPDRGMALAEERLSLYAHAEAVVTTKLHCALPCLALGTPVLLIDVARDTYRFSGLADLLRHGSVEDFERGNIAFDLDRPAPNADDYRAYRQELARRVNAFVGERRGETAPHPFVPAEPGEALIARHTLLEGGLLARARRVFRRRAS